MKTVSFTACPRYFCKIPRTSRRPSKEMCCFYTRAFHALLLSYIRTSNGATIRPAIPWNVLRYVRTRRNVVKPIYMRSCNRFHSYESPHPPSGRVGDVVAMLQIEFLGISNHGMSLKLRAFSGAREFSSHHIR